MKPGLPKGTRDFLPAQVVKRQYIFRIIEDVFKRFGYLPVETPALENLSTLTGKYGEEGDRLLFKILNNGDFLAKADEDALTERNSTALVSSIADRGLRYDLTVPFARFVVMHRNDLALPFKRYQIQPVWRADRPQKGRYREFYQCDADVVGSDSLVYEAELIQMYDEAFRMLGIPIRIRINNRKILFGVAEVADVQDRFAAMTVTIDKLDKIGIEGVRAELQRRGFSVESTDRIMAIMALSEMDDLKEALAESPAGRAGLDEVRQVFEFLQGDDHTAVFDITLARGLNYYTGCIFEVAAIDSDMGSLGGGGRYDDLTAVFGLSGTSGVGASFGAERIFDIMEAEGMFPNDLTTDVRVMVLVANAKALPAAFRAVGHLRSAGISSDVYPEAAKFKKQMKYANSRGVSYVLIVDSAHMDDQTVCQFKDMGTGEQAAKTLGDIIAELR